MRRLSSSGRPALMPRTTVSTASGKAARNFASRRFLRNLSSQSGTPHPAAKPMPSAGSRPASIAKVRKNAMNPITPPVMKNRRFDHDRPACAIFIVSGTDLALACRSSSSLRVPSTCSRRDFCGLRAAARAGIDPVPATASRRFSTLRFAGQRRIDEHPGDAADRDRHEEEEREVLHDRRRQPLPSLATSAASSAAASRCSSP